MLFTLHLYVFLWLSEETVPFDLYVIKKLVFITEAESVYCAVRPESLYKMIRFILKGFI